MRAVRLSALLEHEGRLPVDEATALAWKVLSQAPARAGIGAVGPPGVLIGTEGQPGLLSPANQRAYLQRASPAERELWGGEQHWWAAEEGGVRLFDDEARLTFTMAAIVVASVTGRRPFEQAVPAPGSSGAAAFNALVSSLGPEVPDKLGRILRNQLLWHLEPAPGQRSWLRRPLRREVMATTLLEFVGRDGPQAAMEALGLRVESVLEKRKRTPLSAALAAVKAADEPSREVLADAYEENGQFDEAEWLRLEGGVRAGSWRREPTSMKRLAELRTRLTPKFIAEVSRPPLDGCPVRFGFQCPRRWDELERTPNANERFCTTCDSSVFFVHTVEAARDAARRGQCIAIAPSIDTSPSDDVVMMGMPLSEDTELIEG